MSTTHHQLPTTPFHPETNPFGVISPKTSIDWRSVSDVRINSVDRLYPCTIIARSQLQTGPGSWVPCNLQSNDFMGSLAQVRDQGLKTPELQQLLKTGVPVTMTVMEWDTMARQMNKFLALGQELEEKRMKRRSKLKVLSQRQAEYVALIMLITLCVAAVFCLFQTGEWMIERDNDKYEQRAGGTRS